MTEGEHWPWAGTGSGPGPLAQGEGKRRYNLCFTPPGSLCVSSDDLWCLH
jgi:hypothetical protein